MTGHGFVGLERRTIELGTDATKGRTGRGPNPLPVIVWKARERLDMRDWRKIASEVMTRSVNA